MSEKERFGGLVSSFTSAIIDRLAEQAKQTGGTYVPSTESLKAAAFGAWQEVIESEQEAVGPMLAVAVWEAVMKVNESAFRQGLERKEKAGLLPFKVGGGQRAVKSIAAGYLS